eukprot:3683727-Prymnesium_polylepis.1
MHALAASAEFASSVAFVEPDAACWGGSEEGALCKTRAGALRRRTFRIAPASLFIDEGSCRLATILAGSARWSRSWPLDLLSLLRGSASGLSMTRR